MIDVFVKIADFKQTTNKPLPVSGLGYYQKFIQHELVFARKDFYFYCNCSRPGVVTDYLYEDDEYYFIILGKAQYRNQYASTNKQMEPTISDLLRIIVSEATISKVIKGNFILLLVKKNDNRVRIINSPLGVIPFCYAVEGNIVYLSTNLSMIKSQLSKTVVDDAAVLQVSMFDTILGNHTLVKGIYQLQYGQRIDIFKGNISVQQYYQHTDWFSDRPVCRKDSIEAIATTLKTNSASFPVQDDVLLGLTGGYDCRLNLSLLEPSVYPNLIAYTYGMPSSPEIKIASRLAQRFGLRHEIIPLDEKFEQEYIVNADDVLMIGDGFTPFMRVNYYYAHRYLSSFSRECITGMYGSELIKPMHVMEDSVTINARTVKAFFSENIIDSLVSYCHELKSSANSLIDANSFPNSVIDETIALIKDQYVDPFQQLRREERIFNFYLNEGMRKFFMELIRVDRMFINHTIPFLDLDFVEVLMQSEYAGVHNHIFNESVIKRRKGQLLYVDVMNIFNPLLNDFKVDRGYKPKYLKNDLGWVMVTLGYLFGKKMRKLLYGNLTYNTKKWRQMVYEADPITLNKPDAIFNDRLKSKYSQGYHLNHEHVFGRHFSIKKWLMQNDLI